MDYPTFSIIVCVSGIAAGFHKKVRHGDRQILARIDSYSRNFKPKGMGKDFWRRTSNQAASQLLPTSGKSTKCLSSRYRTEVG